MNQLTYGLEFSPILLHMTDGGKGMLFVVVEGLVVVAVVVVCV